MKVKYRNLKIIDNKQRQKFIKGLCEVMDNGMFMMGKKTEEFEKILQSIVVENMQ